MYTEFTPKDAVSVSRQARDQLHEMMAAAALLAPALAGREDSLRLLAVIRQGLYRQLFLIRRMELDRRLNDPDEIRLSLAPVDFVTLCRELMKQVDDMTGPLGVHVRFVCGLAALPALADRAAFEDMLLVPIANSIRSLLSARREGEVCLTLERQDRQAVLILTDNDRGMDPDALARLFQDPEESSEPDTDTLSSDLALARQIASLHGGTIFADSRQEQGTRLILSFPLLERAGGVLHSPLPVLESERVPSALADCLPAQAFLPEVTRP